MILQGIASLFRSDEKYDFVGTADTADTAFELAAANQLDIIVMDLSMPGDTLASIARIVAAVPATKVIIFTAFSSIDSALKALDAGASGFVLKGTPCADLFEAIDSVLAGQLYVTPHYAPQVMSGLRERTRRSSLQESVRLNVRERQIVGQLLQARTNREIALELKISEKTVKHYMTGLMLKLKARNRVEVVIAARQHENLAAIPA